MLIEYRLQYLGFLNSSHIVLNKNWKVSLVEKPFIDLEKKEREVKNSLLINQIRIEINKEFRVFFSVSGSIYDSAMQKQILRFNFFNFFPEFTWRLYVFISREPKSHFSSNDSVMRVVKLTDSGSVVRRFDPCCCH